MRAKAICFDLDGTIIDSGREGFKRCMMVARIRGLSVNSEIERRAKSVWGVAVFDLIKATWPNEDPVSFLHEWEELDIAQPHPIFPGTKEALETLIQQGYELSILTNRYVRSVAPQLVHNGFESYFNLVATPESSGGFKKPNPKSMDAVFEWHAKRDISKHEIILVGDTVAGDWELAKVLNLDFYAVTSGGIDDRISFLAAGVPFDRIIDSVADLPRVLAVPKDLFD